jgi:hypothetical protein
MSIGLQAGRSIRRTRYHKTRQTRRLSNCRFFRQRRSRNMHISSASFVATLAFLSPLTAAANIGRSDIEARDNVAACKAILVALKASQFCSSFVPIKDVTSTETKTTGTTGYTKVTVTDPCTYGHAKHKRGSTTPATTPSTTPAAPTTTSRVTITASTTTSRVYTTTTASKCTIKGVQSQIASFGCQVIKEACTAFVKPKTIKVSPPTLTT